MNYRQDVRIRMIQTVLYFFKQAGASALLAIAAIAEAVDFLTELNGHIDTELINQSLHSSGGTQTRTALKKSACAEAEPIRNNLLTLVTADEKADISKTTNTMLNGPDEAYRLYLGRIFALGTKYKTALAALNVTQDDLDDLQADLQTLNNTVGQTKVAINARSGATKELERLVGEADTFLDEKLDPLVRGQQKKLPKEAEAYLAARKLQHTPKPVRPKSKKGAVDFSGPAVVGDRREANLSGLILRNPNKGRVEICYYLCDTIDGKPMEGKGKTVRKSDRYEVTDWNILGDPEKMPYLLVCLKEMGKPAQYWVQGMQL